MLIVVVPVRDEAKSIPRLTDEIHQARSRLQHEVIYVDDGSED